jgi:Flp pilus assembly pilin Flp
MRPAHLSGGGLVSCVLATVLAGPKPLGLRASPLADVIGVGAAYLTRHRVNRCIPKAIHVLLVAVLTYLSAWITAHTPARSERGATVVEYALLVVMVAIAIGAVWALGKGLGFVFKETLKNNGATTP